MLISAFWHTCAWLLQDHISGNILQLLELSAFNAMQLAYYISTVYFVFWGVCFVMSSLQTFLLPGNAFPLPVLNGHGLLPNSVRIADFLLQNVLCLHR